MNEKKKQKTLWIIMHEVGESNVDILLVNNCISNDPGAYYMVYYILNILGYNLHFMFYGFSGFMCLSGGGHLIIIVR